MTRDFTELSSSEERIVEIVREARGPLTIGEISCLIGINIPHSASELVNSLSRRGYFEREEDKYSLGENNGN